MGKYNFKKVDKRLVRIHSTGQVYFNSNLVEELKLDQKKLRWVEDEEKHILALMEDESGKQLYLGTGYRMGCGIRLASRYEGNYNLVVDDGVYVLVPVASA